MARRHSTDPVQPDYNLTEMPSRPVRRRPEARRTRRGRAPARSLLKVWVVFQTGTKLGDGRVRLLELIDELGSIQHAVAQMRMSYRAAWGYIGELERAAGFKFLSRKPGGRGGAQLTEKGRAFLTRYRRFRGPLDRLAQRSFTQAFSSF